MLNYEQYTSEEFAADPFFRKWVLDPDPDVSSFWDKWQHDHPEKSVKLHEARELILAVKLLYEDHLPDDLVRQESVEIARLAASQHKTGPWDQWFGQRSWKAAASVVLAVILGWVLLRKSPEIPSKQAALRLQPDSLIEKTNQTRGEMTVLLSDKSVAILSPGSSITYARHFGAGERHVRLSGEAFFDVARDPRRPFLVYAHETVTKVLGTSFRVRAFNKDNTVTVLVKTGKVSVYPEINESDSGDRDRREQELVLMPNQQAVFIRDQQRLEKSMVSNPALLTESAMSRELIFDDRPVPEVFRTMERSYGIQIRCDAALLAHCNISAQFNDENLKQRLNAICDAIGATYEMVDGQVLIHSKGCS